MTTKPESPDSGASAVHLPRLVLSGEEGEDRCLESHRRSSARAGRWVMSERERLSAFAAEVSNAMYASHGDWQSMLDISDMLKNDGEALAASQRREVAMRDAGDALCAENDQLKARLDAAAGLVKLWRNMTFGLGTQLSCADDLEKCLSPTDPAAGETK